MGNENCFLCPKSELMEPTRARSNNIFNDADGGNIQGPRTIFDNSVHSNHARRQRWNHDSQRSAQIGFKMQKKLYHKQVRINRGLNDHLDLENGHWQTRCHFSDRSSEASFVSAKYNSFEDGDKDIFYDAGSQAGNERQPLSGLAGILKTAEVFKFYNLGDSFGSGKYGIIKIVQKRNYEKIHFAMKSIKLEPGYEDYT